MREGDKKIKKKEKKGLSPRRQVVKFQDEFHGYMRRSTRKSIRLHGCTVKQLMRTYSTRAWGRKIFLDRNGWLGLASV